MAMYVISFSPKKKTLINQRRHHKGYESAAGAHKQPTNKINEKANKKTTTANVFINFAFSHAFIPIKQKCVQPIPTTKVMIKGKNKNKKQKAKQNR